MSAKIVINEKSNYFLGIGGSSHDFSACLLKDGKIITAIESERINRTKHSLDLFSPINSALKYIFPQSRIKLKEISSSDILNLGHWREYKDKIKFFNHHLCHASSCFFTSPFKESAIFVCDGIGSYKHLNNGYEHETYSFYLAKNRDIKFLGGNKGFIDEKLDETHNHHIDIPNSLGLFYNFITKLIGFGFLEDGKTMGLSAYGDSNKYYEEIISKFKFKDKGIIEINFGEKEATEFYKKNNKYKNCKEKFKFHADIAASAQKVLENCYFYCLNYLHKITNSENLCLSGGVALNSVANGKIIQNTPFRSIYLFPACGDAGIAVGAAYLSYYKYSKKRTIINNQSPFLGKKYSKKRIESAIKVKNINYIKEKNVYKETAKLLTEKKIIAWFQKKSEFGPRALGHRSIIVDPRKKWMKDYLNKRVKKRESFRPFAPAILEEYINDYFENPHRTPYMLEVFKIKKDKQNIIPAVVHVDGTGRIQTIGQDNKDFYKLIKAFCRMTGVPVILNTSFNINKMPIVETPEEAIDCFLKTNIDILVIENFICFKKTL